MKAFVYLMAALLLIGICITGCSKDSDQTVDALNSEALKLAQTGQHVQALEKATAALEQSEKESGADHPDTIMSLEIMGLVQQAMGDAAGAESKFLRALSIVKKSYGPNTEDAAKIMNNLAGVYYAQNQYILASSFFKQSLAIVEKQLPANDPRLAMLRKNIKTCEDVVAGKTATPLPAAGSLASVTETKAGTEVIQSPIQDFVPEQIKQSMMDQLTKQNIFISELSPRVPVKMGDKGIVFPYHGIRKDEGEGSQEIMVLFAALSNPDKPGAVVFQNCRLISYRSFQDTMEQGGVAQLTKELKEVFSDLYL